MIRILKCHQQCFKHLECHEELVAMDDECSDFSAWRMLHWWHGRQTAVGWLRWILCTSNEITAQCLDWHAIGGPIYSIATFNQLKQSPMHISVNRHHQYGIFRHIPHMLRHKPRRRLSTRADMQLNFWDLRVAVQYVVWCKQHGCTGVYFVKLNQIENLFQSILDANPQCHKLCIMDARPKINAVANQVF